MDKNKIFLVSVIVFSAALIICSYMIADGIKQAGETISYGLQSGSANISNGLYNSVAAANQSITANNDIMNLQEAANYLNIKASELIKLTKSTLIPCIKIGNNYIFSKSAIDKWMENINIQIE